MTSSFLSRPRAAALSIAIAVLPPSIAAAQIPATDSPAVAADQTAFLGTPEFARLVQGKNVWITKSDGTRSKGRVTAIYLDALGLTASGARTSARFDQIVKVQEVTHRVRNGLLIGAPAGLVLGMWLACEDCSADEAFPEALYVAALGAGVGVGIGALVNVLNRHGDVLYAARPRTATMTLSPILSRTHKGVAFSLSWR